MIISQFKDVTLQGFLEEIELTNSPKRVQYLGIISKQDIVDEFYKREIITAARIAHKAHWIQSSNVSEGDKNATLVHRAWHSSLSILINQGLIEEEVSVYEDLGEKIDLLDRRNWFAYELKASGKNPTHEFYKDVMKIVGYKHFNACYPKKLIFLTESFGIKSLRSNLASVIMKCSTQLGFEIELHSLDEEGFGEI